ncbi:MAG TPA: glucose 1-dehydrogenase [Acetobacteraceae bacterium]|nr:glucose 1-dehydrogenase [Acetobacteraceae bacterium]
MPDPSAAAAFSLEGAVALITGGATGLGFATAQALIAAGATAVLAGRREHVLQQAVERLGARARYEVFDVTRGVEAPELMHRIRQRVGPISILVNNAGIHFKEEIENTPEEAFQAVLQTHVLGAFSLSRAAVPEMASRGGGSILFMASMTALIGMPKVVAYSAAKSAYVGMVRSMATELAPRGIRVNAIAPGWIESVMLHQALDGDPARKAKILGRTPMGRFGEPADIGWAAVYLCSPAARFITGVVLPVDGGASIGF